MSCATWPGGGLECNPIKRDEQQVPTAFETHDFISTSCKNMQELQKYARD